MQAAKQRDRTVEQYLNFLKASNGNFSLGSIDLGVVAVSVEQGLRNFLLHGCYLRFGVFDCQSKGVLLRNNPGL
jgi:hypothetical protein